MNAYTVCLLLWFLATSRVIADSFPNILNDGPTEVETLSVPGNHDGPQLTPGQANATSYQWWYFAAVSASSNASLVLIFWNNGPDATRNPYLGGPYSITMNGTYANGSVYSLEAPATGGATIHRDRDGIEAVWEGSGFSFTGSSLDQQAAEYVVTIDNGDIGIQGTMTFKATGPARYPCSLNVAGETTQMMPHLFWANALPAADVTVDVTIGESSLSMDDGVGYYETAWGDEPLVESLYTWYWGFAQFGPYSVVWFDVLDPDKSEHFSGYVGRDGHILQSSCAPDSVVVRPWGANSEYPPVAGTPLLEGVYARFQLDNGSVLAANITKDTVVFFSGGFSSRMLGTVEGGVERSDEAYEGRALFEEMKLAGTGLCPSC